jgi:arylsulfatase A-like enzyme
MPLLLPLLCVALAQATRPNIVFIVADDMGWADVSLSGTTNTRTPHIDALYSGGMRLSRLYGQPVCTPSRAAIHTGRLPLAYGLQTYVIPDGADYGLDLNETTLPELLRDRGGYSTAAVGKWHLGNAAWAQTPTFRGYNSFHGFYLGGQDYYTHMAGGGYDFHRDAGPQCGGGCSATDWASQGLYSTHVFTSSACSVIAAHNASAGPLFLYLAYQAVHSPDEVPAPYKDAFNASIPGDDRRRTFAGMLAAMDEGVGNVTRAVREAGMEGNTIYILAADNGGPIHCSDPTCGDATGTSNWPLRGGKHSLYEGGTRLLGVVSGPMLYGRAENHSGLMHHADWLPTLLEAAGVAYTPAPGHELHGVSQWPALTQRGTPSPRNESVLNIDPFQPAIGSASQGNAAIVTAEGWKLHVGMPGPPFGWSYPNSSAGEGPGPGQGGERGGAAAAAAAAAPLQCSNASALAIGQCLPGGDLPGSPQHSPSAAACCSACSARPACTAFTHRASTSQCYLKSHPGQPTRDADCTSSAGAAPPPAVPLWPLRNTTLALYNVLLDEGETTEVSALHPDVVAALQQRLAAWAQRMSYDYWESSRGVDPRSNPALHNGTWTPWL